MDQSVVLGMPYIMPSQAQKHVTHNEAIRALDAIVQIGVSSRILTSPPATPTDGDRYIVAPGGLAEWAGKDGQIAIWEISTWSFYPPQIGWLAWVGEEGLLAVWDGAAWADASSSNPTDAVGVNTTADATNKLAVKSDAILFSHDDVTPGSGSTRLTLNKAGVSGSASMVFQTGFSGRAEFGTTGDDDWHVKVSADGANWTEALVADKDTGNIGLGISTPTTRLHVNGPARVGTYTVTSAPDAVQSGAGAMIFVSDETGGAVLAFSDGTDWRRVTDRAVIA